MISGLEVSLPSVTSVTEENDHGKNTVGDVKDRSLSYLDIHIRDQLCKKKKVFESVRKFGRPRQQISDALDFGNSFASEKIYLEQYLTKNKERYHFGQCLVLPKVSTQFPKGNSHQCKNPAKFTSYVSSTSQTQAFSESYDKEVQGMFGSLPRKVIQRRKDIYEFENRMYRWNEVLSENYHKNSSRKSSIEENGNINHKSSSITKKQRDLMDYYNDDLEDIEAQINSKYRHSEKGTGPKNEYYFNSSLERRRMWDQDMAETTNQATRISDIRDNWQLRVIQENKAKQSLKRKTIERSKIANRNDLNEKTWENSAKPSWIPSEEYGKRELQRSKSTPDMLERDEKQKLEVWNFPLETKRNGSMMDVYDRHWKVNNDQQEADSLNDPNSLQEPVSSPEPPGGGKFQNSRLAGGKNFFGHFLTSPGATPINMLSNTESFSQFWVILSNIYGQILVILMLAFSLTEVMDNSVKLLSLQGIFLMYLYVGSIAVIICIYIWVLIDSCSSIQNNDGTELVPPTVTTSIVHDRNADFQNLSSTKFGSLKKAHISRDRTSNTSFYLRIGAIAFGLGTLVFNGLEMAMHSMMESSCLNDVVFVHPILHGLFTFLQMHFLFVNSQVLVEKFGLAARFGFMHLAATNLALWIRLVVWDSGNEWAYFVHQYQNGFGHSSDIPTPLQLKSFPKFIIRREREITFGPSDNGLYQAISKDHISQVVSLHQCLNNNSLGQLWTSSMPFLYPFIIQFSIIAAAVTFIMGQNVAKDRLFFSKQKKVGSNETKTCSLPPAHDSINAWSVDCSGASKGLFLGILCLVTGVVVIIIFLVVKENEDFPSETIFWLTSGTLLTIISITIVMNVVGLVQIRKLSVIGTKMTPLDKILSVVSVLGVQLYTILGIVVGASGVSAEIEGDPSISSPLQKSHGMLLAVSLIQLIQAIMQNSFIVEGIRRTTLSRTQAMTKPARQVITFLMFSNAVLWAFDTFVVQSWISQELQLRFFGVLTWGVVSRIGLPLLVFFRFHSCVMLLEMWKKSYQSLHLDPGN